MGEKHIRRLIQELLRIRTSLLDAEKQSHSLIASTTPSWRESARNLIHYVELRRFDVRGLQTELAEMGLSSLGRSEAHVMSTIDAVIGILSRPSSRELIGRGGSQPLGFRAGVSLLEEHTRALLGAKPADRSVRIMVTMPSEAVEDYSLVKNLVSNGADCVRINTARDNEDAWRGMVRNLRKACKELRKTCKVEFDLAGRKLRTKYNRPPPQVIKWSPKRDELGKIVHPARILLTPRERLRKHKQIADASLSVDTEWLRALKVGTKIRFRDLRGKKRTMLTVSESEGSWSAESQQTAYVGPATVLSTMVNHDNEPITTRIEGFPQVEPSILLRIGDILLLTTNAGAGREFGTENEMGGLTMEALASMKSGQQIWFDDGKIGGIVEGKTSTAARIRITNAKPQGSKLRSDRGINLPTSHLDVSVFGAGDRDALSVAASQADSVGLSFVRSKEDIEVLFTNLNQIESRRIGVVLKVETRRAFENLPSMLLAAMRWTNAIGVMIARGDLAVEAGYERLAEIQEEIFDVCEAAHTPVILASEVLESLAKKGTPSRAEITDAAMSIRADCVMLNRGPFLVKAVQTLNDILRRMETHQRKKTSMFRRLRSLNLSPTTRTPTPNRTLGSKKTRKPQATRQPLRGTGFTDAEISMASRPALGATPA